MWWRYSAIHADHYFLLRIEDTWDIVKHTKLKKRKLAIWSKILSQKAASFLTTRKGEEGVVLQKFCLQSMCQTQPLVLMNDELYFYIIEMIYEKRRPCSRTKYEWTVVNLLALFAVLKSLEIWTMTSIDIWWTVLSIQVWNSHQCLLVFYTRYRNTN